MGGHLRLAGAQDTAPTPFAGWVTPLYIALTVAVIFSFIRGGEHFDHVGFDFGFVHVYQGPAGAVGATISGLIFGILTVMGRGSIWPAALAHGANNSIGLLRIHLGQV